MGTEATDAEGKKTNQKYIAMAICVFLLAAVGTGLLIFLSYDTEGVDITSDEAVYASEGSHNEAAMTTLTTRVRVRDTTTKARTTTITGKTTNTRTPMTATTRLPWTLPSKTLLCTFGYISSELTAGPQEGLCDIIFLDHFYNKTGTFIGHKPSMLKWFLRLVRNGTGVTQFGIGIDRSEAHRAYTDLSRANGMNAFNDFWNMKIRHYGLLKLQVHETVLFKNTMLDYDTLLKRLRELQELNRAGANDKFGYIILGVDLFPPRTGQAYDYLKELFQTAPIDAVIIRTHIEDNIEEDMCRITGPNVYLRSWNTHESSMVEALEYVQTQKALFNGRPLMVSFSMAALKFWPEEISSDENYQFGEACALHLRLNMEVVCREPLYHGSVVPGAHVMMGFSKEEGHQGSFSYDSPTTINWKICSSTRRYPNLQLGVALFDLQFEDGLKVCLHESSGKEFAGYWRTAGVSSYMKTVIRAADFLENGNLC